MLSFATGWFRVNFHIVHKYGHFKQFPVGPILHIERVQRRATKFILSLPYNTDVTCSQRLAKCNLIPIMYWQEFLHLTFLYKLLKTDTNKVVLCNFISIYKQSRFT